VLEPIEESEPLALGDVVWMRTGDVPPFDVHARTDLQPLRLIDEDQVFAPSRARPNDDQLVLAHGTAVAAVLVDDPCAVEEVVGRDGASPSGRLLLAPVRGPLDGAEMEYENKFSILPTPDWPISGKQFKNGAIIDLGRLFGFHVTGADDVEWLQVRRVGRLPEGHIEEMLWRLAARTVRRGPLVARDTEKKLEALLGGAGHHQAEPIAATLGEYLRVAYLREGEIEDVISTMLEREDDPATLPDKLRGLYDELQGLLDAARAALD
jgi:hypothetical protein